MRILEIITENKDYKNWIFPSLETMRSDFTEYKKKEQTKWESRARNMGFRFPIFDQFEDFVQALKNSPVEVISSSRDSRIQNRSRTSSIANLKGLVSNYKIPRDVDRIVHGFENNAAIPYPIILKGSRGEWIMAGNTRLDTAFITGVTPKAIVIDVSA